MRVHVLKVVPIATLLAVGVGTTSAALVDRGGGLLYDTVLNITWLQDANYARTSGFDPTDGQMSFAAASDWVSNLSFYHAPSGKTFTDWRLPTVTPINGVSFNYNFQYDGNSDNGFNISSKNSELGYMFFVNLGLTAQYDKDGNSQPTYGVPGPYGQDVDVGLVKNLKNYAYWTQTNYTGPAPGYDIWVFSLKRGSQDPYGKSYGLVPWAVAAGDIAPVPEPSTIGFWLAGIALVFLAKRRAP